MAMHVYGTFLVLISFTTCTLSSSGEDVVLESPSRKSKRQIAPLYTAWRKVLKGAWLTSKGPYTKWYSKIGGQKEAISDFKSLKPTHVVTQQDGLSGRVGGRNVHVFHLDDLTMLGIMGKGSDSAIAPYNGFRAIQYIKRRTDTDTNKVPSFKNNYFR